MTEQEAYLVRFEDQDYMAVMHSDRPEEPMVVSWHPDTMFSEDDIGLTATLNRAVEAVIRGPNDPSALSAVRGLYVANAFRPQLSSAHASASIPGHFYHWIRAGMEANRG